MTDPKTSAGMELAFQGVHQILCLGAHADDIEIGCGGTLLRLMSEHEVDVQWVVFSGDASRRVEARQSAEQFLNSSLSNNILFHEFPDGYFPTQWHDIKRCMADLAERIEPDLIFTHRLEDRHQDHRTIAELTWNHFRRHLILEFEIPKYEGDLQTPNLYLGLTKSTCQKKVDILTDSFKSQHSKPWFTPDTFWSLLRLRGIESGSPLEFAEGFYARKIWL